MSDATIGDPAAASPSQDAQQPAGPPEPAAALPKLDPETLAIRTKPESAIRFRRGIIIGIAALGSVSLMAVTWVALKPQVFRQVTDAQELAEPSNRPATDALDALPSSYGDAPKLGPPLPGDLGGPILEHQRAIAAAPPAASIDQAAQATEAERQRAAAERKAALESALMVQVAGSRTSPAAETAAAPAVLEGEAGVPVAFNPDRDPDSGRRQTDLLTGLGQADDLNPHALAPPVSPYTLRAGTVIAASLITGLNSDLPGLVTAQVTEHVFDSATGRILLIPQGSRLIGATTVWWRSGKGARWWSGSGSFCPMAHRSASTMCRRPTRPAMPGSPIRSTGTPGSCSRVWRCRHCSGSAPNSAPMTRAIWSKRFANPPRKARRVPAIRSSARTSTFNRPSRYGRDGSYGSCFTRTWCCARGAGEVVTMTDLKLRKLPDRTPVKLTLTLMPNLKRQLDDYLTLYQAAYDDANASLGDIIPPMLESFLASDRAFAKARKSGKPVR
jgi:hypothetical protein